MAVGDEAAAAGLPVVPATGDVRLGYVNINELADAVARHLTSGTHPFTRITGQLVTAQLADTAVTTTKIRDGAVTTTKIGDGAVTTTKIEDGAVTGFKLTTNSVNADKIVDRQVTRNKLAQRYSAGNRYLTGGQAGDIIETGLSGTVAVVVTDRDYANGRQYSANQQNASGRFLIRAWEDGAPIAGVSISWIAVEV